MEPKQAFGTGLHPSTQLSVELLEDVVPRMNQRQGSCLDVGTGSGILAIVASKLGVSHIVVMDKDPVALSVAEENFILNGCPGIRVWKKPWVHLGVFNLVVSNITSDTHVELLPMYQKVLVSGGKLILSGVLDSEKEGLVQKVKERGFHFEYSAKKEEWVALVLERTE